jgi:tetratricopeptide (TPR) repeat protein
MTASPLKPMTSRARERLRARPLWRRGTLAAAAVLLHLVLLGAPPFDGRALAEDRVKGEVKVTTDGGYVRLGFRFEQEVPATVELTYPIMVIVFKKPVAISVDRLSVSAGGAISAARLDPDGMSIRIALSRKAKFNSTPAAERLYIDLLPESWSEAMPGLPRDVVEELAKRALDAERQLRLQRLSPKTQEPSAVRVKVATQPTFSRYVFAMPDLANVVPENTAGRLSLEFDQPIKWDLADVKAAMPATLRSVDTEVDEDSATVVFAFNGNPKVRTFREDRSIVVDVGHAASKPQVAEQGAKPKGVAPDEKPKQDAGAPAAVPGIAPPETVPAKDAAPPPPQKADLAPWDKPDAAAAKPAAAPPPPAEVKRPYADPNATVVVDIRQSGDRLQAEFPFAVATPAAVFQRSDTVWLIFDSPAKIDLAGFKGDGSHSVRSATLERGADGEAIVRIKLERPRLISFEPDSPGWVLTIDNAVTVPSRPLAIARSVVGTNRASLVIPFDHPGNLHRIADRDVGDRLLVVTALGPVRGFLRAQSFVELHALPSMQGVVLQPIADDVTAELAVDKISVTRPSGLSLSPMGVGLEFANAYHAVSFDAAVWNYNRQAKYNAREAELIQIAAMAPNSARKTARLNLARFFLARGMAAEAKGVLDVVRADSKGDDDVTGAVLDSVANLLLHRPDEALKDLANVRIGNQLDAPIWRAIAYTDLGKWPAAQAAFKNVDGAIAALPVELQRLALRKALRTAIEVRDFNAADGVLNDITTLGISIEQQPALNVLIGRLKEAMGRNADALASYHSAALSFDRQAAAQGRLGEILLRYTTGDMTAQDATGALETLTTIWRGDDVEPEGLKLLAHLYTVDNRYRAAFHVMRTALLAYPDSESTRQIQDEARINFDSLFLGGKADSLAPIEALGLFYDYRDLTPVGFRGDEMIRRLADRLVAVDLLDQAAELLQHQVDNRLQGVARAQVATRLAVIYLMNRKPERAIATLQKTRTAELSYELRDQRLLLEARALSETGRHNLALELIANIASREAIRLRSDILWSAKRWRAAAEQIEMLYGERWKDFTPLTEPERFDILRAAIGYSLGEEPLGLARFRERYAPIMMNTPDGRAFDVVSAPVGTANAEFQDVAKRVTGVDSLEAFLRDMRTRYPDSSAISRAPVPAADAAPPAAAAKPAAAVTPPKPPAAEPPKADRTPTGSISRR